MVRAVLYCSCRSETNNVVLEVLGRDRISGCQYRCKRCWSSGKYLHQIRRPRAVVRNYLSSLWDIAGQETVFGHAGLVWVPQLFWHASLASQGLARNFEWCEWHAPAFISACLQCHFCLKPRVNSCREQFQLSCLA